MRQTRITIISSSKPHKEDINKDLQWFCDTLGMFESRDKDNCRYRMFIVLLNAMKNKHPMSSDEIADKVNLSRGTVVHHLNKMMDGGLIVSRKSRYMLRVNSLSSLIDELERDLLTSLEELRDTARKLDDRLEL